MKQLRPVFCQEEGLQEDYILGVNYAAPLESHLKAILRKKIRLPSHYRNASVMLPDKKLGKKADKIFSLVYFPEVRASAKSIIQAIRSVGWEPADYHEGAGFILGCPDLLKITAPVMALGSIFKIKDRANYFLFIKNGRLGFKHATDLILNGYYLVVKNETIFPIL